MKDLFSSFFEKMTSVTLSLCGMLCGETAVITPKSALDRSKKLRNECLNLAEKQFITPICREDIAAICLKIHRLNWDIYGILQNKLYELPNRRCIDERTELYKICRHLHRLFENGFPKNHCLILDITYPYERDITENNRYNYTEIMYNELFCDKIRTCSSMAVDILEIIAVTVIKNT